MRILFIGGTGIISTACTELALARGHEVYLLNRGRREVPLGATPLVADLHVAGSLDRALAGKDWDVVVNFVAFGPDDVAADIARFSGRTGQYVFISSASAYQRPARHYLITEETPLENPFWEYSRKKIAAEEVLRSAHFERGFPSVIVRPSHTYSRTQITLAINSWAKSYTVVDRMRKGRPVIVPGDGSSLWTLTHASDFAKGLVGLFGNGQTHGQAFHITSDEVATWDHYYLAVASAAGVTEPNLVHIATDFLIAGAPELRGTLQGDKATSCVFDNSKIKRFVPDFACTTPYEVGVAETLAWFDADASRRVVDDAANANYDRLIAAYQVGVDAVERSRDPVTP